MKIEEPESMKEIRRIRARIYEEIKDMTPEERVAHTRKKSEALMKKYGLKLKTLIKTSK